MIILENVIKRYQMGETLVTALNGVSFHIQSGEFVSLIGASGSGKSTLLNMIGLLDRPDTGRLQVGGRDTSTLSDDELSRLRSETIGFVFQQFHLLQRMTALENVELPLIYAKGDRPSSNPNELLDRVGLGARVTHRPNELSGGQQQRVAIARALIRRPTLVLADEPTGNLDSHSGAEIMRLLRELHAEGLTVVLVTHEPSLAAAADRTIRMHDGKVAEDVRKPHSSSARIMESISTVPVVKVSRAMHVTLLLLNFQQAIRGLWSNKMRTSLSVLGIIIGIAAVIVMLALGDESQKSVRQQIENLGADRLVIIPNFQNKSGVRQQSGQVSRLTLNEAINLQGRIPTATAVTGGIAGDVQVVYGHNNASTGLQGVMPGFVIIQNAAPAYGRFFTMEECRQRARVVVLGTTVLTELFGSDDPIGQTVQINHIPFTVIGTLPSKGSWNGRDRDDCVIIPLQTAMFRVLGSKYIYWIDVALGSPEAVDSAQKQLMDLTREWPQIPNVTNGSYQVISVKAILKTLGAVQRMISWLLAGAAAISLVVGGIGIMNIMLISVTERTREIGLRKAVGARKQDIQFQFLIEAVSLCACGGCMGIVLGWIITIGIGLLHDDWINPSLISVLLSSGFSVVVGIGFGYWPAVLASRLNPIEALRQE